MSHPRYLGGVRSGGAARPHRFRKLPPAGRVAWAGCGISLPRRLVTPRGVRLAVRKLLADPSYAERAGELRDWAERHDGGELAAQAVEELA